MEDSPIQEENHIKDEQTDASKRIVQLESEKKKIIDGFDLQRAKMRELYQSER